MPRDPNIPDAFDVFTLVLLRRPADAPAMPDEELDALQARHLAYRASYAGRASWSPTGRSTSNPTSPSAAFQSSPAIPMRLGA